MNLRERVTRMVKETVNLTFYGKWPERIEK